MNLWGKPPFQRDKTTVKHLTHPNCKQTSTFYLCLTVVLSPPKKDLAEHSHVLCCHISMFNMTEFYLSAANFHHSPTNLSASGHFSWSYCFTSWALQVVILLYQLAASAGLTALPAGCFSWSYCFTSWPLQVVILLYQLAASAGLTALPAGCFSWSH